MPDEKPPGWDMPFEELPATWMDEAMYLCSGVMVMAATIPLGENTFPGLIFRFVSAEDGEFIPPVALILDRARLKEIPSLVEQAVNKAIKEINK